jgi:hypothetical protein
MQLAETKGAAVNTKHTAKIQSHRTGIFATLGRLLRPRGTGAPSNAARVLAVALGLLAVIALPASAQAASPWWHLSSGSRPTYLVPGSGAPEIPAVPGEPQTVEVTTSTEGFEGHPEQAAFQVHVGATNVGAFATEPLASELGPPFIPLTAANLQTALDGKFGPGEVTVTALSAGATISFEVTAPSSEPITVADEGIGHAQTHVIDPGTPGTPAVPATPDGEIYVTAVNIGDQSVSGANVPIEFSDLLPAGLEAVAIEASKSRTEAEFLEHEALSCSLEEAGRRGTCTLSNTSPAVSPPQNALAPFDTIEMRISVNFVAPDAQSGATNQVTISGGEGFDCQATPGIGIYRDSGCIDEVTGEEEIENSTGEIVSVKRRGGFERTASGAVAPQTLSRPIVVNGEPAPFGVEEYELRNEEEGGGTATQAGSHPFQQTTAITLNQTADTSPPGSGAHRRHVNPVALPKDLSFRWPPGLVGNPSGIAECSDAQFFASGESSAANQCPAASAVGVAVATVNEPGNAAVAEIPVPLFNLTPHLGEPARLGFNVVLGNTPVVITPAVRDANGEDYGLNVNVDNITQTGALLSSVVTVWGVPGDPRHNRQRGWSCMLESRGFVPKSLGEGGIGTCGASETSELQKPVPFLALPTSCSAAPQSSVFGDTWANPLSADAFPLLASYAMPTLTGCNRVPFAPSIESEPTEKKAASPTGLTFDINIHDEGQTNAKGLVQSAVEKVTVALPTGVTTNPAVASGLSACTLGQYEEESLASEAGCPESSKLGEVEIQSPLVKPVIHGSVYVAKQLDNPAHNLLSIYMVAKSPELGVMVRSAGAVTPNEATGQLTTTFDELPQLPFSHFHFAFRSGPRAPLITPGLCGTYTTGADLYPYANPTVPVHRDATFTVSSAAGGGPCASQESQLPNKPTLEAGTVTPIAGAYSPFVFKVNREDGSQALGSINATLPEGLLGKLAGITECSNAQIHQAETRSGLGQGATEQASPSCPASSQVGVVDVGTGAGPQPYVVQGKAYLAGPYKGAPLSLAIVTPAVVGPFDLGTVAIRTALYVNETTAQITAKSDPIPQILHGLPTVIRSVSLQMNRPNFTINPTSCEPKLVTAQAISTLGLAAPLQQRFQVGACGALGFKPSLKLSLKGATKRSGVPALKAVLTYPKGNYANIKSVSTVLPKSEFIDNAHIGNTCTRVQFNAGAGQGAQCPSRSVLGHATAYSPLLDQPLKGTVYLRSNGGERELPDIVAALKGQIPVTLVGFIDSVRKSKNSEVSRLRTRFMNVPDAPVSRFVLQLAGAKKGLLENSANLCKVKNIAQVKATAQNGKTYDTEPAVANDCGKKGKKSKGKK